MQIQASFWATKELLAVQCPCETYPAMKSAKLAKFESLVFHFPCQPSELNTPRRPPKLQESTCVLWYSPRNGSGACRPHRKPYGIVDFSEFTHFPASLRRRCSSIGFSLHSFTPMPEGFSFISAFSTLHLIYPR